MSLPSSAAKPTRNFHAYQMHTSMFQKRKQSPRLLLEFVQPSAINQGEGNKLEKLLKDSFSSQKIEIKTYQYAISRKETKSRNFLRSKLRTVDNANQPQFKFQPPATKHMVNVSQSKLNVLESLNPIISKFNSINHYEINNN